MAKILAHPFRLVGNQIATVEQHTDEANTQQLAVLLLTVRGERELVPSFGIEDPAFRGIDVADVNLAVALHGPPVRIKSVETRLVNHSTQEVVVSYG